MFPRNGQNPFRGAGLSPRHPLPGDPCLTELSARLFELKQFASTWGFAGMFLIRK